MVTLTQEQINELLEQAKPSIIEGLKKDVADCISWSTKQEAGKIISQTVSDWVKENIVPEITKSLIEGKDGLVSSGISLAPMMVEALTAGMLADFKKKMESEWERRKVFDALFKN